MTAPRQEHRICPACGRAFLVLAIADHDATCANCYQPPLRTSSRPTADELARHLLTIQRVAVGYLAATSDAERATARGALVDATTRLALAFVAVAAERYPPERVTAARAELRDLTEVLGDPSTHRRRRKARDTRRPVCATCAGTGNNLLGDPCAPCKGRGSFPRGGRS